MSDSVNIITGLYTLSEYLYTTLVESEDRKFLRTQFYSLENIKYTAVVDLDHCGNIDTTYLNIATTFGNGTDTDNYFQTYRPSHCY